MTTQRVCSTSTAKTSAFSRVRDPHNLSQPSTVPARLSCTYHVLSTDLGWISRMFAGIDKTAGLDVIVTCGQDPCEPTQEGMLEFLIAGLFVSSVCIVGCVVLMYGRGKLSWIVN